MTHFEKLSFCSEGNLYVNFKRSFALDAIYAIYLSLQTNELSWNFA